MYAVDFAFLATFESIGRAVVGVFAIAGGFLIGNWLTFLAIKLGAKLILKKQPPVVPTRIARLLGGVALAILVAYFVFGEGGLGFGNGSGTASNQGKAESPSKQSLDTREVPKETTKESPVKDGVPPAERIKVVVLGGDIKGKRFYLVDDDPQPHTFSEVTSLIRERQASNPKGLRGIAIYVYSNSAAMENYVVVELQNWAKEQGLEVSFPPVQNQVRPGS